MIIVTEKLFTWFRTVKLILANLIYFVTLVYFIQVFIGKSSLPGAACCLLKKKPACLWGIRGRACSFSLDICQKTSISIHLTCDCCNGRGPQRCSGSHLHDMVHHHCCVLQFASWNRRYYQLQYGNFLFLSLLSSMAPLHSATFCSEQLE